MAALWDLWRAKSQETFHRSRKSVIEFIVLSAKKVKGKKNPLTFKGWPPLSYHFILTTASTMLTSAHEWNR